MNGEHISAYETRLRDGAVNLFAWRLRLQHVEDEYLRLHMANVMELQSQHIAAFPIYPELLKGIAQAVAYQTAMNLPLEFMSYQSLRYPNDLVFYLRNAGRPETLVGTKYAMQDMIVKLPVSECTDAKSLSIVSIDATYSIIDKVINSLIGIAVNKSKTFHISEETTSAEAVLQAIECASQNMKERIGRSATFAIMPPACVRLIKNQLTGFVNFDDLPIQIRRVGMLNNRIAVFINSQHQSGFLLGYRGPHPIDAPLAYCPGVTLNNSDTADGKLAFHHSYVAAITNPEYLSYVPCDNIACKSPAIWEF